MCMMQGSFGAPECSKSVSRSPSGVMRALLWVMQGSFGIPEPCVAILDAGAASGCGKALVAAAADGEGDGAGGDEGRVEGGRAGDAACGAPALGKSLMFRSSQAAVSFAGSLLVMNPAATAFWGVAGGLRGEG